jgi:hypothetical protein
METGRKLAAAAGGIVTFVAAVLGIFVALNQLGIGPFGETESALAAAAHKTSDAGSATLDLAETIQIGSKVAEVQLNGKADFRASIASLESPDGKTKQRLLKPYAYILGIADDEVWCQYDLSVLGQGFLFGALTGFDSDPGKALVNLDEFGTYEEVGHEKLFGVDTTHYSGHIELSQVVAAEKDPERRKELQAFTESNSELPVDVWISSEDFVRRITTSYDVPASASERAHVDVTFDFSDFGIDVEVKRPPGSETASPGERGCPEGLLGVA